MRRQRRGGGEPWCESSADFGSAWGSAVQVLPMTDDVVATKVETDEGMLDFKHYFVRRRCEPIVRSIRFEGATTARPGPGVIDAISNPDCEAVLIAPSNPFLSVDPILAVPGIREALAGSRAPVIAVSPIVGGKEIGRAHV